MYRRNDPIADCRINSIAPDVESSDQPISYDFNHLCRLVDLDLCVRRVRHRKLSPNNATVLPGKQVRSILGLAPNGFSRIA